MAVCSQVDQLEEVVVTGCRMLALSSAVRSIQIVTDVRPGYPELVHLSDLAKEYGLLFIVRGSGRFTLLSSPPPVTGIMTDNASMHF